jgi:hypothetical protein
MIRLLPRREFSLVQSHLFPKYFFLNSLFTYGSMLTFLKFNPIDTWKNDILLLVGLVFTDLIKIDTHFNSYLKKNPKGYLFGSSFLIGIVNFTFFNIKTIQYSSQMREIEKVTGEDNVIGKLQSVSKIENDPEYKRVKKNFLIFHGLSASTNLLSIASSVAQLYILSSRSFFSFN